MKYDARACKFNTDTGCVELLLRDGRINSTQAAVAVVAVQVLLSAVAAGGRLRAKQKRQLSKAVFFVVRIRGLEPPPSCPD